MTIKPEPPAAKAEPPICLKCGRHGVLSEAGLLWVCDHGRVNGQERGVPADQVDWRECSNRHLANFKVMMAERDALQQRLDEQIRRGDDWYAVTQFATERLRVLTEQNRALREFVGKIATIRVCDDEPTKCYQGSGPYCGTHGDVDIDDEIAEARKLLAALATPGIAPATPTEPPSTDAPSRRP
jgi:hypothetical protein